MPWAKGQSGNPGGRRRASPDVKAAFAAACPDAVATLVALLQSKNETVRLRAADVIITRHLGPAAAPEPVAPPEDQRRRIVVVGDDVDLDVDDAASAG